ncbi:MAG: penicillin-binding protein, partial [Verrucomicrobiaceae bacterium]
MRKSKKFLRFLGWTALFGLFLVAAGVITGVLIYSDYEERAAQYDISKIGEVSQRSVVYDVNGELYSYLHGENRLVVPLEKVSGWFVQALLAREDSRFWEHGGVDYLGIARAIVTNLRTGDVKQGASTITQQLARNSLDLGGKNYDRKALEAVLAQRMERTLSKKEILEMYVNRIYFGSGFYGIETASRGYFGKSASELDLNESAILAGLIRSPNRFSPRNDLKASLAERDTVLNRMIELYMISHADAEAARTTEVAINHEQSLRYQEDYAMDAVNRELQDLLDPDVVAFGGLKIYATIDPELQRIAREAADRQLTKIEETKKYPHPKKADFEPAAEADKEKPTDYLQAALVAVDNRSGAIRAIVGGRDYAQSKYSRAVL